MKKWVQIWTHFLTFLMYKIKGSFERFSDVILHIYLKKAILSPIFLEINYGTE